MSKKTYDAEFKAKVVLEALKADKTAAQVCREFNIAHDLLSRWKADFVARAPQLFRSAQQHTAEHQRIAELERLVGQLTLELATAKKLSKLLPSRSRNGETL
jgi:transposase-like protein